MNMRTQHWLSAAFIQNKTTTEKKKKRYILTIKPPRAPPVFPSPPSLLLSSWFWRVSPSMRLRASASLLSRKSRSCRCFSRHAVRPSKRSFIVRLVWRRASEDLNMRRLYQSSELNFEPFRHHTLLQLVCHNTTLNLHPDMSHQEHSDHWPELIRALRRTGKTYFFVCCLTVQQQQLRSSNIYILKKSASALTSPPPLPISLTLQVSVLLDEDVHLLQGFLQRARLTGRARDVAVHHGASRRHDAERKAKQVRDLFSLGPTL